MGSQLKLGTHPAWGSSAGQVGGSWAGGACEGVLPCAAHRGFTAVWGRIWQRCFGSPSWAQRAGVCAAVPSLTHPSPPVMPVHPRSCIPRPAGGRWAQSGCQHEAARAKQPFPPGWPGLVQPRAQGATGGVLGWRAAGSGLRSHGQQGCWVPGGLQGGGQEGQASWDGAASTLLPLALTKGAPALLARTLNSRPPTRRDQAGRGCQDPWAHPALARPPLAKRPQERGHRSEEGTCREARGRGPRSGSRGDRARDASCPEVWHWWQGPQLPTRQRHRPLMARGQVGLGASLSSPAVRQGSPGPSAGAWHQETPGPGPGTLSPDTGSLSRHSEAGHRREPQPYAHPTFTGSLWRGSPHLRAAQPPATP